MKQTAVNYLVDQLLPKALTAEQYYHIEQAKQMEKEQLNKCYHPLTQRKHTSDTHFECTICGYNNY